MIENTAFVGGSAVFCVDAYSSLTNNTVVGNPVLNDEAFYATAAIHNHISKSRVINSIIRDNPSSYFLGGQLLESKAYYTIYNDIEGGHEGSGNFDLDPRFLGDGQHPFALGEGSPCFNAGLPDVEGLHLPELDIMGAPRIQAGRVDVGAYEWTPTVDVGWHAPPARRWRLRSAPNPSAGETTFTMTAPQDRPARLSIYDLQGRHVVTLLRAPLISGVTNVAWDGCDEKGTTLASGIYVARLVSGEETLATTRLVVLR
jgi:hypothetical protein